MFKIAYTTKSHAHLLGVSPAYYHACMYIYINIYTYIFADLKVTTISLEKQQDWEAL